MARPYIFNRDKWLKYFWGNHIINNNGCWEWQGPLTAGYGRTYYSPTRRGEYCHRLAYAISKNVDIPNDKEIMHICDNPKCYNPKHLKLGSHRDNILDCISKGRFHANDIHVQRTHCKQGHPLTLGNIFTYNVNGHMTRTCIICSHISQAAYRAKRRLLKKALL